MTGDDQCLQIRQELGVYLLGTIEPAADGNGTQHGMQPAGHPVRVRPRSRCRLPEPKQSHHPLVRAHRDQQQRPDHRMGTTSTGTTHGFLDSDGTMADLGANLIPANFGYQLNLASAINDNGPVVATADNAAAVLLASN
jgi:hypothetical protein